ncbi:efflux RND transporter periplasmic adaptor subunit [Anaeromyxobacter diazotrophicus]|uniref:Hemolysin D n=1 Tax=Anaeromyxobacter diazotrophicus TaxID=2590199 RepID=A0A7I9VKZ4_9BACT|nr:efflux RND transporter periplasmic adaptor subunit [Anaeromyxobacter diazotrophicus]GEJ57096.1 hemolysin D [Anaeromyxobacter diazotrophicus]
MDWQRHEAEPAAGEGARRGRERRALGLVLAVALVAALAGVALLLAARHRREAGERDRLARAAERGPAVLVARAELPSGARTVTLPGDVRAFWQATLYAKVNGYVQEMRVDKGQAVKKGEVLARIASPETDQQVRAARATLEVRRRNAARAERLAPHGVVSRQELDQARADLGVAQADARRVAALQEYQVLRAPFDGVVTARYVDPGALLTASATGAPVVDVASPGRVRILVYVGQDVAPFVKLGDPAEVALDAVPGVRIAGRVARLADALDPRTRSMLVEVWPEGEAPLRLVPGLFVHVALRLSMPPLPSIPSQALVARGAKLQVALVQGGKLHFVDVEPGVDDGRRIQVRRGLAGGEVVALSPPSDLGEGAPVEALTPEQQQAAQPGRTPGGGGSARAARAPLDR